MRFTISGRNIEVTESMRRAVTEKLGKLEHYFTDDTNVIVTMSVEKDRQKIEVTIPLKKTVIRSEQVSNDMYVSIDLVEEVIERQLRRYRQKLIDSHRQEGGLRKEFLEEESEPGEEIRIVRDKHFDIKPMYPEDACVQMELLGHSFYVFRNAENDETCVVYKRKGGTYGLIEPEA